MIRRIVMWSILGVLLLIGGCFGASYITVSDGFRDGYIRKLSTRGIMFKTHEGELGLDGVSSAKSNTGGVWEFTVLDPKIIKDLESVPSGHRVRLYYKQYFFKNPLYGDTDYRVIKVEEVKEGK